MKEELAKEMEKSRVVREKQMEQEKTQDDVNEDFQNRCVPALIPILTDILEKSETTNNGLSNGLPASTSEEDSRERVQRVRDLLKNGEFDTVAHYIVQLDVCNLEKRKEMPIISQVLYFRVLLNSYLFDDYVSSDVHSLLLKLLF